ncbi:MAG: nitroreductase family protein [Pseudomonadota bacterium]
MTLTPRPEVVDFLLSRRSRPAKTLSGPGPDRAAIETLLQAAARSPDHGKLEPWRFIVLEGAALARLSALTDRLGEARGDAPERREKDRIGFERAPVAVAVVASPKPSEKIPEVEQLYSAGAVCLALLNAALASGWGANWLSGWMATDPDWLREGLSLAAHESVAGFIHIGSETVVPPDRPRPEMTAIVTWATD